MIGSIASKLDPAEQRQQCDSNARATAGKRYDIAAVQCGECFGTQQAVRVGDDADLHGYSPAVRRVRGSM